MGKRPKDQMYIPFSTKDSLEVLVSKICEEDHLLEATVRDLLRNGWMYQGNKWIKHGKVVIVNSD